MTQINDIKHIIRHNCTSDISLNNDSRKNIYKHNYLTIKYEPNYIVYI